MPELVEVELYRRTAERAVGRRIESVDADDDWFCKGSTTPTRLRAELPGRAVVAARRHGKLLLLELDGGTDRPVLGLRFGMTGRLLIDGASDIGALLYSSGRDDPAWDRFGLRFVGGGSLTVRDPRRLGGVELDPVHGLGPDAATVSRDGCKEALQGARGPVKAALLDQTRLAGIGNLIADETLWRVGIAPSRPVPSLTADELDRLARAIPRTIALLQRRGGSHLGDLVAHRGPDGRCPRDGTPLSRSVVGGRSTYACPEHQR